MSDECFVPKCKNSVGAPFPRDHDSKQKWLEALQLPHATPKAGSFVCFAHFDPVDVKEEGVSGRRLSNRLKRGAVPCNPQPVPHEDTNLRKSPERGPETEGSHRVQTNKKQENLQDSSPELPVPEVEKICRACMTDKNLETHMFDFIENEVTISSVFMLCVFPIEVSKNDALPKHICRSCLSTLRVAYKFRKKCMQTDDILRARCSVETRKRKSSTDGELEKSAKKSCQDVEADKKFPENPKDMKLQESETSTLDYSASDDFEVVYEEGVLHEHGSRSESQEEVKEKHVRSLKDETKAESDETSEPERSKGGDAAAAEFSSPTRRSQRLAHKGESSKGKSPKSRKGRGQFDIDEIEKNMEEIHGQHVKAVEIEEPVVRQPIDVEEVATAKTCEDEENTTVEDILNTLEEGNASSEDQYALEEFLKKSESRAIKFTGPQKKIIVKSNFPTKIKRELEMPSHIKLPKDLKIRPVEKFQSAVGKFPCSLRAGVYDSLFVQANEYLFELGLVKGSIRHLRCTVPTCPAHGKQRVTEDGDFDTDVDVVIPHNHPSPNEAAKKKQMFLCLMRKKMQTDRTLNIRNIYEDACIQDPDIKQLVPLRNVINEICRHQLTHKIKPISSFEDFFKAVETDPFEKLHFTHNNQQFYQEKFAVEEDGSMAILFGNTDIIQQVSSSKIMYVDASFKIDTNEEFKYQLVTVLVWIEDSYYPILFALVNKKSQQIFRKLFGHLHDELAPDLRPQEIITDYEANLYYALAEIYIDSNIGGSVFYYTQNLYKKICSLNLSRDLETNSYFRNIYHMLLMLPLLPVNTILDGLNNIELEARNLNISDLARPIFDHVRMQWILNVTPELFCVHKLENRINENVIAPFKKLRDFLLLTKGKLQKTQITIMHVIEKLIELESFLRGTYSKPDKKSFGRDLSSFQKKNVLRAWQFIEDHPKIEINNFFSKVLGYIKCMENQLWIWGFYRYDGDTDDILINAAHFSIVSPSEEALDDIGDEVEGEGEEYLEYIETPENTIVMEAVIDQDGVLQAGDEIVATENVVTTTQPQQQFETAFLKYVYQ